MGKVAFQFHAEVDLLKSYGGKERTIVEPLPAIWRSVRETPPIDHLRDSLARVGDLPCRLVSNDGLGSFQFDREERALAECLRVGELSLDDLCAMQLLPRHRTELLFYCLLITKQIEGGTAPSSRPAPPSSPAERRTWTWRGGTSVLPQAPTSSAPPASATRSRPPSASSAPSVGSASKLPLSGTDGVFGRARSILREDHFQRLGVSQDATQERIEQAFHEAAQLWSAPAPPQIEGAQEAQETVVTALVEAYETLMDAQRRDEYTRSLRLIKGSGPTLR
jgi:hypothetical protein